MSISCTKDEEIVSQSILDRNVEFEKGWEFIIAECDSISPNGNIFYKPFPDFQHLSIHFYLKNDINNPTKFIRRTDHYLNQALTDYRVFIDTLTLNSVLNDSLVCKIVDNYHSSTQPDSPGYYPFTFHGKYNLKLKSICGYVEPYSLMYRCGICPGKVYYYYHGPVLARMIPINY